MGGFTPLMVAKTRGKVSCLRVAAREGHADIVADLLDAWDGWPAYETGWALRGAALSWRDNTVALLLARVPYEADTIQDALKDLVWFPKFLSILHIGVGFGPPLVPAEEDIRRQSVVGQLVDAGANPDGDLYGQPLLHEAASSSDGLGALKVLLERGANPNLQDTNGKTALHKLFGFHGISSPTPALRLLLQHGASPETVDEAGEIPLHAIADAGTLEQFQICLTSCPSTDAVIHLRTSDGESHLHYAAAGGRLDIVEFLLSRGLHVDSPNSNGWTPLVCALTTTRSKSFSSLGPLATFLLQQGASTQVVTEEGWTLLHALATYTGKWTGAGPLARELIARGTPVDKQARVLRSPSATAETLCRGSVWGNRMRRLAQELATTSSAESLGSVQDEDTTPLMWAYRTGAMDVFNAITEHWASANQAER